MGMMSQCTGYFQVLSSYPRCLVPYWESWGYLSIGENLYKSWHPPCSA